MSDSRKQLMVLCGVMGCGKTTVADTLWSSDCFYYSTDTMVESIAKVLGMTYDEVWPDKIREATNTCNANLRLAIKEGKDVLWDQTNLTSKKRTKVLKKFDNTYRKVCHCVLPPMNEEQEQELQRRLKSRQGKHIPANVISRARNSFQIPSTNEGFNRVQFYDIYGNSVDRETALKAF